MYDRDFAIKIKEKIDKENKPVLVQDSVDYIANGRKLKFYYSNDSIKNEHIDKMKRAGYEYDSQSCVYDILYDSLDMYTSPIIILRGIFYEEMKPFL